MIKEKHIHINITSRNKNQYIEKYNIDELNKEYLINIEDVNKNSKIKITAICDICGDEHIINVQKYFKNKSNQGYYGCKKCSKLKSKKTNQEKYGVDYPLQNKDILNRLKQTVKNKYGIDNVFQLDLVKEKSKETCKEKYGFEYPLQNEKILKKQERTNIEKYGFKRPSQNENIKRKISEKTFDLFNKFKYVFLVKKINDNKNYFVIKCDNCKSEYEISEKTFYSRILHNVEMCTICNPINSQVSGKELKLLEFIKENYSGEILTNDRTILDGKEIDILLSDINLGFEFNGNYWHSEKFKDKNYHINKVNKSLEKGIQLIHIWEDVWDNQTDMIKEKIINLIEKHT